VVFNRLGTVSKGLGLQNEGLGTGSEQLLLQGDGIMPEVQTARVAERCGRVGKRRVNVVEGMCNVGGRNGFCSGTVEEGRKPNGYWWATSRGVELIQSAVEAGALQIARASRSRGAQW
jgi:hypothetical protein